MQPIELAHRISPERLSQDRGGDEKGNQDQRHGFHSDRIVARSPLSPGPSEPSNPASCAFHSGCLCKSVLICVHLWFPSLVLQKINVKKQNHRSTQMNSDKVPDLGNAESTC